MTPSNEWYTAATTKAVLTNGSVPEVSLGLFGPTGYQTIQDIVDRLRLGLHLTALPMNILNIFVYMQRNMRSSTSTYHLAMSLSQIAYILVNLVVPIGTMANLWTNTCYFCVVYNSIFSHFLAISTNRAMYGIICLVATERFLAIAFPLKSKLFRVCKTPVISVLVLYSLVVVSHVYLALRYEVYESNLGVGTNISISPVYCDVTSDPVNTSVDTVFGIARQKNGGTSQETPWSLSDGVTDASSFLPLSESPRYVSIDTKYLPQRSVSAPLSPCSTVRAETVTSRTGETVWSSRYTSTYLANPSVFAMWSVMAGVVWVYIAVLLGLLTDILLVAILLRHSRQRSAITTSDSDKRDRQVRQTTLTVLTSSLVFVVLSLLPVSNALANSLVPSYGYTSNLRYTFMSVHALGQLSFSISLCTDLLTFLVLSSSYRTTLVKMIARVFQHHKGKESQSKHSKGYLMESRSMGTEIQTLSGFTQATMSMSLSLSPTKD
ncbi:hypothetical protein C0Q70_19591 [Pomacea canaliculata]|uniref:G-protein coupled receptors family 1 profile domain-containing protein n=2 Tax=Pomacea canaliculata TaxID=400727 RepID=A0A2T7NJT4_POMCA|nr:hypothetical protein C0Q70_19591 [Pomacea canaliculata]